LKEAVKKREEERVYYDHYKEKVRKMEEPGQESTSTKASD
jgi:hypothetical protein